MLNYIKSEFQASYGLASQLPPCDRPEIVFCGRSNVGKSSIINKICNRRGLARVSSTPGKTATINFYRVDTIYFVDLPGYGYAKVSDDERARWDKLINSYFESDRDFTLVQLLDSRHLPSVDDFAMMKYLQYQKIPFIVALTKGDKLCREEKDEKLFAFQGLCEPYGCQQVFMTSAASGYGIEKLRDYLAQCAAPKDEEKNGV